MILLSGAFIYYPKWQKDRSEATISWDVSGYYFYLPAFLIYKDARQLSWQWDILNRYDAAPPDQAYRHESGNMVMKYSVGLALQYLPFFLIADAIAPLTNYPADGFSRPYQLAISIGSLLMACVGLWFLRLALRKYFNDGVVAWVLVTIVLATNYLDYASIDHAMSHNYLFTWYAVLIILSERYWKTPGIRVAAAIGAVTGLMALTRPTEVMAILLPALWGISSLSDVGHRWSFFKTHPKHLFAAIGAFMCIGAVQVVYWKYATGDWIVYSYQDQSFSWFSPHLINGLFSYRAGWLIYTPVMFLSLIGFYSLRKKNKALFYPLLVVAVVFMYITWSWDIWWYGGSLGQRAMVQIYPVLAFPLAASLERCMQSRHLRVTLFAVLVGCIYYNLWLTHQAHRGGLFRAGEMTKAYFWKILGRYSAEPEAQFLLDCNEKYRGSEQGIQILHDDFEQNQTPVSCGIVPVSGTYALCVGPNDTVSHSIKFDVPQGVHWLRASAMFRCTNKEWDIWKMPQFRLELRKGDIPVKINSIRIFRAMKNDETKQCTLDLKIPKNVSFDQGAVEFLYLGSSNALLMDDLTVFAY